MNLNESNLLGAVNELKTKGYNEEYIPVDGHIDCAVSGKKLMPDDIEIEQGFQFDITENTNDSQFLFAVKERKTGTKGLLIDLLGEYKFGSSDFSKMLNIPLDNYYYNDKEDRKYGLTKIFKEKFYEDPSRYEFRIGYPDFPACPFGNSYQALGFDRENNEYVWLVTSIIKDKRLNWIPYNA